MSGVNESAISRVTAALAAIDAVDRPEIWIKVRNRKDLLGDAAQIDAAAAGGADLPLAGLLLAAFFQPHVMAVIAGYLALNVAYTFVLKHQPVLDIFSIAIGFVLRIWAGAVMIDVPLSGWMQITTLCLALYLAAVKRRQEILGSGSDGREVLDKYSPVLIERYAEMSATGALVFYSLFVMSANQRLTATIPLVIFGLFRYWYVVERLGGGESPTDALLSDLPLLVTAVAWIAVCGIVLYF